ncbi:MAG: GntP family permease [Christensenellales bacterium]
MRIGFVMCIAYSLYELLALFLFLKSDYNTGNTCRNDETKERTRGHIHEWTGIDHPIFGVDGIPVCDHCALQDESVFSMISAAIAIGVLAGMDLNELVNGITSGFGSICAGLGIVVAMGFLLGGMLSEAGATDSLADATLRTFGEKRASLAMNITGYIVSIPVFYGSAYVILNPILNTLSRKTKKPIQVYITALSVGLLTTHCMVIPTPGPLSVAGTLGVNFGWFILYSLIVSIPGALIGGWLYGEFLGKKLYKYEEPVGEAATQSVPAEKNDTKRAPAGLAIAIIALPLLLIVFGTLIPMWTSNPMAVSVCKFLTAGNGVISLIISVAFAALTLRPM